MKRLIPTLLVAPLLLVPLVGTNGVPLSVPTHTKLTWYSALKNSETTHHAVAPQVISMRVSLRSGGGGGMGSQSNMNFGSTNPIPYWLYGKMGTESCWDTHAQTRVAFNGPLVTWPGHPFVAGLDNDNPIFFTTTGTLPTGGVAWRVYYVRNSSITANTFEIADVPYNATDNPPHPGVDPPASAWSGSGSGANYANAYKRCVMGGGGGGAIGDQGIGGRSVGWRFDTFDTIYVAGAASGCALGAGGRGSGAGGTEQFGTSAGNLGVDQAGGGGSGGGMGANYAQIGPCGGAEGSFMRITLKPTDFVGRATVYLLAGTGGAGGKAGPGGWAGGRGGHGLVLVEEDLP